MKNEEGYNKEGYNKDSNNTDEWKEKIVQNRIAINMIEEDMRRINAFLRENVTKSSINIIPFSFLSGESYLTMASQVRKHALDTGTISVRQDDDISLFPESEDGDEVFY